MFVYTIQPVVKQKFPARDAIQRYLPGVYMCAIVFSSSFYCICCQFFLPHIVLYTCCYGLRLSNLIKETTYLENLHAKTIYQYIHATYCKKQVTEQA